MKNYFLSAYRFTYQHVIYRMCCKRDKENLLTISGQNRPSGNHQKTTKD
jgi:hypothetical protein